MLTVTDDKNRTPSRSRSLDTALQLSTSMLGELTLSWGTARREIVQVSVRAVYVEHGKGAPVEPGRFPADPGLGGRASTILQTTFRGVIALTAVSWRWSAMAVTGARNSPPSSVIPDVLSELQAR